MQTVGRGLRCCDLDFIFSVMRVCGLCSAWLCVLAFGWLGRVMADPTGEEQYYLELLNRARLDPQGELQRLVNISSSGWGVPASNDADVAASLAQFNTNASVLWGQWAGLTAVPAIAWSDTLASSAQGYSQLMIDADLQTHTLGGGFASYITANGYAGSATLIPIVGQNLYATAESTEHAHAGFLIDWGAGPGGIQSGALHRALALDSTMKEFGVGVITTGIPLTNMTVTGPQVVSEHFGHMVRSLGAGQYEVDSILTGVVFEDTLLNDVFYTPGEGLAGLTVNVYEDATNALLFTGLTNAAGGFNIGLAGIGDGDTLRVEVPATGLSGQVVTIDSFTDTTNYGAGNTVTFYNNAYARFVTVPEPGSALLVLCATGLLWGRRRRGSYL
jgi:uncharacterized protein YkwD